MNVIKNNVLKNAPLIAVMMLVLITIILFFADDTVEQKSAPKTTATAANTQSASRAAPQVISSQAQMTTDSNSAAEAEKPAASAAPMLANLISGLEKKVAADPSNTGSKMLLAQTYAEIGEVSRGVKLLEEITQAEPGNIKISLVLASVLGKSDNPADLKRAMTLLDSLKDAADPDIAGSVLLQRGRLYRQMGETESARAQWEQALNKLPATSGYRKQVEIELARLK